jgi:predicted permease
MVSEDFFPMLGVKPILGRAFLPEEHQDGKNQVLVLSYGFWQRHFGGRQDVLGQTLRLSGTPHTIVGVMPAGFKLDFRYLAIEGVKIRPDLWAPMDLSAESKNGGNHMLTVIARLKPGVSLDRAQAEMTTIARRVKQEFSEFDVGWGVAVDSLDISQRGEHRLPLLILLLATGLLLLIACVNIANLLLARAIKREKEFAIRAALGARRGQLVGQLLSESVLLSVLGGSLGLLLAFWCVYLLNAFCRDFHLDWPAAQVNGSVLGFTFLVSLLTGMAFGLAPALRYSQTNPQQQLKEGGHSGSQGTAKHRLSGMLVVCEVGLATVMLVGAGLLLKSFRRLSQTDPGFRAENILTLVVRHTQSQQVNGFPQVLSRISALPGVQAAALTSNIPTSGGGYSWGFQIEGRPNVSIENAPMPHAQMEFVSPRYFSTLSIPLKRGRYLAEQDSAQAPAVVVISETLARKFWAAQDPLGQRIELGPSWRTIVGVVGDVRQNSLAKPPEPQAYVPYLQYFQGDIQLVVRTAIDPLYLISAIKREVRQVCPDQPVVQIRTLEKMLAEDTAYPRLLMSLMGGFAALALILASVGIYGVLSHLAGQRSQEIGIRMALGARHDDVLRLVLGHGLLLVLLGETLGIGASLAVTRVLASQLFGVTPTDPWTFTVAALLLLAIALLACYVPARRASRVDPLAVLKYE